MTTPPRAPTSACLTSLTCLNSESSLSPGTFQDQLQISKVSHLIEDGVDPLFVQQQAGHSWASTTAIYTTVGADARNRMLRSALSRAYAAGGGEDGWR
jgi:site-specific recombinase XerD